MTLLSSVTKHYSMSVLFTMNEEFNNFIISYTVLAQDMFSSNTRRRGGRVVQRCRESYVTGRSNWYWLSVRQGLLSL